MAQLSFLDNLPGDFRPRNDADWSFLRLASQNLFKPKAPIDDDKLFAGRISQISDVVDTVFEDGAHAVIFGERGVGKTSLANIVENKVSPLISSLNCFSISCSPSDSFYDIWSNALFDFEYGGTSVSEYVSKNEAPYAIQRVLESLDNSKYHLFIFDEFDRIQDRNTTLLMSDLIKHFSNNPKNLTIIIVGVGDTLLDLFKDHQSVERCCAQIKMQRMSNSELREIISERIPKLRMSIHDSVVKKILKLSQGLPGYVHLLGQQVVRSAIDRQSLSISEEDLGTALRNVLERADYSTKQDYYKATASASKDNKYKEVLLACALADTNELGMFYAGNVVDPYSQIRGRPMKVGHFAFNLSEFCSENRGPALIKSGQRKRYQYRFANPLLQPLTIMLGVRDGLISFGD